MATPDSRIQFTGASREEHAFPTLTPEQIARILPHGRKRTVAAGEVVVEVGDATAPLLVVTSGELRVVQPTEQGETLIVTHHPGQFSGEASILLGRRALARVRAGVASEVIEVGRDQFFELVQTDAEISEILMRAFMLRRVELIAHHLGDVVLIGSAHSSGTLRVREFLTRNGHPYNYVDLEGEGDVQEMLDRFQVGVADVPVLICRGTKVLRNPSNQKIAECLGFSEEIDSNQLRDLVIVGAGPAGLAAAVYGASEGLDVLVLEANAPGGQAGSSSRIENYLGFPAGIAGQELAGRAYAQAQKFGAHVVITKSATQLTCDRKPYTVQVNDGVRIPARAVIIATGAEYRRPAIENLQRFEGAGVYYGATFVEAQICAGEDVVVIGGGNSAGQAAVFLAQSSRRVHLMVRSEGLSDTMSRYLIRRIDENPKIESHTSTEMVALGGSDRLESVTWRDTKSGRTETRAIKHLFVMAGAVPNTSWLQGCVALDDKGFIKTGTDLTDADLSAAPWRPRRPPYLLETSLPGVFAVGDVRRGNVKRVASAVGEGSIAVSFVHRVLAE